MRLGWFIALGACGRIDFETPDGAAGDGPPVMLPAPVAAYPLDEAIDQTVTDVMPGMVNGVLGVSGAVESSDPARVPGKFGRALSFDAGDDKVFIAYATSGYFVASGSNDAVTVLAWARPASNAATYRVVYEMAGESNGIALGLTDTARVRFIVRSVSGQPASRSLDSSTSVTAGNWYFLAGTSDPNGIRLYVYDESGTLLDTQSSGGPFVFRTGSDGISIGNNPTMNSGLRGTLLAGQEAFDGTIDELRIYDVGLTQAQVEAALRVPAP